MLGVETSTGNTTNKGNVVRKKVLYAKVGAGLLLVATGIIAVVLLTRTKSSPLETQPKQPVVLVRNSTDPALYGIGNNNLIENRNIPRFSTMDF